MASQQGNRSHVMHTREFPPLRWWSLRLPESFINLMRGIWFSLDLDAAALYDMEYILGAESPADNFHLAQGGILAIGRAAAQQPRQRRQNDISLWCAPEIDNARQAYQGSRSAARDFISADSAPVMMHRNQAYATASLRNAHGSADMLRNALQGAHMFAGSAQSGRIQAEQHIGSDNRMAANTGLDSCERHRAPQHRAQASHMQGDVPLTFPCGESRLPPHENGGGGVAQLPRQLQFQVCTMHMHGTGRL